MIDALNAGLALLILALAVWTVVARNTFGATVGFVAYGLLLTLVWVQLHGVDVALTEAAIGGGLTGAMLIHAATRLRKAEAAANAERPGVLTRVAAAVMAGGLAAALAVADVSLTLALLAAFASIAFVKAASPAAPDEDEGAGPA